MKTCKDFPGECCSSCHEDADYGYAELLQIIDENYNTYAIVCCKKRVAALTAQARDENGKAT